MSVGESVGESAEEPVFGVEIQTSITYANVEITLTDAEGNTYVYGRIPVVVAKIVRLLKEQGTLLAIEQKSP